MTQMTRIEELKAAYEAATPGQWEAEQAIVNLDGTWEDAILMTNGGVGVFANPQPVSLHVFQGGCDAHFTALAHNLMPQMLEAMELLKAAREQYMRHQCDDSIDVHEFFNEMQGILAGDVCSETLEKLGELK